MLKLQMPAWLAQKEDENDLAMLGVGIGIGFAGEH